MKTKALVFSCILCVVISLVLVNCATMRSSDKIVYERLFGTWANEIYEGKGWPWAKMIFNPDGTHIYHASLLGAHNSGGGTYTVEKKWTDSEGNSWYQVKGKYPIDPNSTSYYLIKIDTYNWRLEIQFSGTSYPATIDSNDKHSEYLIYYRY